MNHVLYKNFLQSNYPESPTERSDKCVEELTKLNGLMGMIPAGLYVLDYRKGGYRYINSGMEGLTGLPQAYFLNPQRNAALLHIHPDDRNIINGEVFPEFLRMVQALPDDQLDQHLFSLSYRYIRPNGDACVLMQRSIVLDRTSDGLPLSNLSLVTDITFFQRDTKVLFSVHRLSGKGTFDRLVLEQRHPNANPSLTPKEMEVLKAMGKGLVVKQIATGLNLSVFTVKAHIRNIKIKLGLHTAAELVRYAVAQGLS